MMFNRSTFWPRRGAYWWGLMALLAASYGFSWKPSQYAEAFAFNQPRYNPSLKRGMSEAQHCFSLYMGSDVAVPSWSVGGRKVCGTRNNFQLELMAVTRAGAELLGGDGKESSALLLRVNFSAVEVEDLREWIRRYPFGMALPVQPFSLVETSVGVDVVFRKKPTLGKGSKDGGLSFMVEGYPRREGYDPSAGPTLTLRRISEGQEIRKVFAERIVIKALLRSLSGEGKPPAVLPEGTRVCAVLPEGLL